MDSGRLALGYGVVIESLVVVADDVLEYLVGRIERLHCDCARRVGTASSGSACHLRDHVEGAFVAAVVGEIDDAVGIDYHHGIYPAEIHPLVTI